MLESLPLIVVLAIIGAVVYFASARRRRRTGVDPGIGTVRRLYFYSVSFVALMMAASGLVFVIQFAIEGLFGGDVLSPSRGRLATGASLVIVGTPLWAVHWIVVQRHVSRLTVERRSIIRKLYLYAVMGVAVAFAVAASLGLLQWAFRVDSFGGFGWTAVLVWSGVWAYHWRIEGGEGQPTAETLAIRRLYTYLVCGVTLGMAATGIGRVIYLVLLEGYDSIPSSLLLTAGDGGLWRPSMREALSMALVAGAAWWGHWRYFAGEDSDSTLRRVYLFVFVLLAGVVTVLASLGVTLNEVLTWLLGVADDETAASRFRLLPGAVAGLSVGVGLSAYHWAVARREADTDLQLRSARSVYAYALAGIGLVALVVGIGTLVHAALAVLTEESSKVLVGRDVWREPVALGITLGVLGAPLWGYFWSSIQRQVAAAGPEERTLLVRRTFIFIALGVGMLSLLGSSSAAVFLFLRDLLGDGLSRDTLRDTRPALDVLAAAAIFLPYYWLVYRQDRAAEPDRPDRMDVELPRKEVSVLATEDEDALVRDLEGALGYRVQLLLWADPGAAWPTLSEGEWDDLARQIGEAVGERVLLVPDAATFRVLSYR